MGTHITPSGVEGALLAARRAERAATDFVAEVTLIASPAVANDELALVGLIELHVLALVGLAATAHNARIDRLAEVVPQIDALLLQLAVEQAVHALPVHLHESTVTKRALSGELRDSLTLGTALRAGDAQVKRRTAEESVLRKTRELVLAREVACYELGV